MIKPFADDDAASSIGGLSVENGTMSVVLTGSVEITRDQRGLERAKKLKLLADRIVEELETGRSAPLTDKSEVASLDQVENPFA